MLCHFLDPNVDPKLAFVQFPQRFYNINNNDTYCTEHVLENQICSVGMDGLDGMSFMGTNAFFKRDALLGKPNEPQGIWNEPNDSENGLALARHVADCSYEDNTKWGSEVHFSNN